MTTVSKSFTMNVNPNEIDISKLSSHTEDMLVRFAEVRLICDPYPPAASVKQLLPGGFRLNPFPAVVAGTEYRSDFVSETCVFSPNYAEYAVARQDVLDSLRKDGLNDIADKLDHEVVHAAWQAAIDSWPTEDESKAREVFRNCWEQMKAAEYELYRLGLQIREQRRSDEASSGR
jgi:hypothetical protein